MNNNTQKRKEKLLKELAKIEENEQNDHKKNNSKSSNTIIGCTIVLILILAIVFSVKSGNNDSTTLNSNNNTFIITDKNYNTADRWLKKNTYENEFDHSNNTEQIECYSEKNTNTIDGMKVCLNLNFETEDTNDPDYPFELVSPTYELLILVKNTNQVIDKLIVKTDNNRFELNNENLQTEILYNNDYTAFISEISISKLKSIVNSNTLSIKMYNDNGQELYSSNSKKQLINLKKQIKVGEIFYSLKGSQWNFE